ncbi:uncharacterized protein LOC134191770 [Corticium candelabrum]|uniref:uncharacterized protein LOC134191770 n=1 Tax=Corticium candelabrum TaxID=121492 RepID=UPI002E27139C|nr:uncharacterized protein LOC134191770 [Corticium candelabrum]
MVTSLSLLCSLVAVSVAAITSVSDASKEVLQIGALLPSNSSSNDSLWSSFRSVDACYLAVDHVNDYSGLLPNHELRLIFRETMCEFGKANYGMYQFVHSSEAERPVVLLGEGCGVVTEPLAETMEMWNKSNVVLFNFLSSSSSGLDLEEKSNAYMSLLPAASELNSARVELMHKLEWKNAVILYETSTGTIFDRNSKDLVKKIKKVNNNATGLADRYLVTMGNITHIFDKIKASKKRILFSFCYENVARRVVCEVGSLRIFTSDRRIKTGSQYLPESNPFCCSKLHKGAARVLDCNRKLVTENVLENRKCFIERTVSYRCRSNDKQQHNIHNIMQLVAMAVSSQCGDTFRMDVFLTQVNEAVFDLVAKK